MPGGRNVCGMPRPACRRLNCARKPGSRLAAHRDRSQAMGVAPWRCSLHRISPWALPFLLQAFSLQQKSLPWWLSSLSCLPKFFGWQIWLWKSACSAQRQSRKLLPWQALACGLASRPLHPPFHLQVSQVPCAPAFSGRLLVLFRSTSPRFPSLENDVLTLTYTSMQKCKPKFIYNLPLKV